MAIFILFIGVISCSGGGGGCSGCDGMATVPYPDNPPPGGNLQADVVRARLTQSTLDFLATHLEPLLKQFLVIEGREARFVFPDDLLPPDSPVLLGSGSYIAFDLDNLQEGLTLTWLEEDGSGRPGIEFKIRRAELNLDILFSTNIDLLTDAACRIQSDEGLAALKVAELSFDLRLRVDRSGPAPQLTAITENVRIQLAEATDEVVLAMTVTPCDGSSTNPDFFCNDPLCAEPGAECAEICGLVDLFTQLGGFLAQIIQPVLDEELAPTIAGFLSDALIEALGAIPLGIETQLSIANLLGPIFRDAQPLNLKIDASDDLAVAGEDLGVGLDLGMSGGVATLSTAPCAVAATPPDLAAMQGPPPEFTGWIEVANVVDSGTHIERYHFVATISQALLNQATWNAFQSGLFCFNLDAEDIEALAGDKFTFTAGLLQTFDSRLQGIAAPASPMLAALRVTEPPTIRLGAGHLVATNTDDPLLEVAVNNLELGLFMLIDDAQLRVSNLGADLLLMLKIERNPKGHLDLVVHDIQLLGITQIYNEMVPASDLSDLFELVVDIVVDAFLGDNLRIKIDLSDTISSALDVALEMRINTVRRDYGPTQVPYLSLYATLCDEKDLKDKDNATCYIPKDDEGKAVRGHFVRVANEDSLYTPPDNVRHPTSRYWGVPSGRAELLVDSDPPGRYELQTRVDDGPWSSFREPQNGVYEVKSARLYTMGGHRIEARVREVGQAATRTESLAVDVWLDRERPVIEARRDGDRILVEAADLGSPETVSLWWRQVNDDAEGPWQPTNGDIDISGLFGQAEIMGRDAAGNESLPAAIWLGSQEPDLVTPEESTFLAGGCTAATPGFGWLGLLLLWRRRRRAG